MLRWPVTRGEAMAGRLLLEPTAGESDEATFSAAIARAIEIEPTSFSLRGISARSHLRLGKLEAALADADAALALRPDDPAASALRAAVLLRSGRAEEARTALERVQRSEYWQLRPALWLLLGQVELATHREAEGIPPLERYVESEPGTNAAWELLEHAYTAQGRDADAARARRIQATNLYLIALDAERNSELERARDLLRRALAISPEHAQAQTLARLGVDSGLRQPRRRTPPPFSIAGRTPQIRPAGAAGAVEPAADPATQGAAPDVRILGAASRRARPQAGARA
jgi:tetratricopeptide (TPR) repeat protein